MKTLWSFSLLLLLCADIVVSAQQKKVDYCEPISKVKAELDKLILDDDDTLSFKQKTDRRLEMLPKLLKKYPKDIHVLKANIHYLYFAPKELETFREEYRVAYEKNSQNPIVAYLYAHSLFDYNNKKSIEILNKILETNPDFPQVHLLLANIYYYPEFRDKAKMKGSLRDLYRICPNSYALGGLLIWLGDKELIADRAMRMRIRFGKSIDPYDVNEWKTLWSLEFKLKPINEHAEIRSQIADDLIRLRALKIKHINRLLVLRSGYRLLNDKLGIVWVENEMERNYPTSITNLSWKKEKWYETQKSPDRNATNVIKLEYYKLLSSYYDELLKRWPNNYGLLRDKFYAAQNVNGIPESELFNLGEAVLKAKVEAEKNGNDSPFYIPISVEVAGLYLRNNFSIERVPVILIEALEEVSGKKKVEINKNSDNNVVNPQITDVQWLSWPMLVMAYVKLKQPDKARDVITAMSESLKSIKPDAKTEANKQKMFSFRKARYWYAEGELAEFENRKLDALISYQTALTLRTDAPEKDDLWKSSFDRVWKELGGTDIGRNALANIKTPENNIIKEASYSAWSERNDAMKDFELTDIQGKKWRLTDLKGKTVFINFWATWCGPCKEELPFIEQLHQQMKDKKDVLIVTFNIDENVGLVEPFLKSHNYTFATVIAEEFAEKNDINSIPRNWIIAPDGTIKSESLGFNININDEAFVKNAVEAIEKVKNKK